MQNPIFGSLLEKRALPDLPDEREHMVSKLRDMKYAQDILDAVSVVPRHVFAPAGLWRLAYKLQDLWGETEFLYSPQAICSILEHLELNKEVSVLEYGTGSGYLTILLSMLSRRTFTVEHDLRKLWLSSDAFREIHSTNIEQKESDMTLGWAEKSPFDRIVVPWALPRLLDRFVKQLSPDGILIAPIGNYGGPYRLTKLKMNDGARVISDLGFCTCPELFGVWSTGTVGDVSHDADPVSAWSVWAG